MARCPVCGGQAGPACRALLSNQDEREIATCSGCGTSFYWPVPDAASVARAYPTEYVDGFVARYWPEYWKGRRYAAGLARFRPEGDYLDVGCGVGTMLAGIRDFSRWRPRGLEMSPLAVETGRTLHGADMAPGDVFTAGGTPSSADWILVNNVLEHVPDPKPFLARCADLLRPGGRLHLLVPNGPVDLSPNLRWFSRGGVLKTKHAGHLYFFT
ncbi:MAG: methyltransferase domain-containing protein, partial [bacterium]